MTESTELQLEDLIVGRALQPGERLPSERDLGQQLGVSKTVVREAIRSLAAKGLVEVRAGSGTYIRKFDGDVMSRPMHLLLRSGGLRPEDIHEVRQVLEIKIAGLAAERAQASDLEGLQETVQALQSPSLSALEFAEIDVAFHQRLAAAAGNPLFFVLSNAINDVMIEVRLRAYERGPQPVERAIYYHGMILDRVREKDVEGARTAMEEHLGWSLQVMRQIEDSEAAEAAADQQ